MTIQDVSPTRANTSLPKSRYTTGRMKAVASSDAGRLVFAGSLASNIWISEDGGEAWIQNEWPQPPQGQFAVPGAMGGYCVTSLAVGPESSLFLVERNPRIVADITNDGRADIVAFADSGVWTALGNEDGIGDNFDVLLTDMQFVPRNPRIRFAAGLAGAFRSFNGGATWERLLDASALLGRPTNYYFDQVSDPVNRALYVGFAGRSLVKIMDL